MFRFRLLVGQLQAWAFNTRARCRLIWAWLNEDKYHYVRQGNTVWKVPKKFTTERIRFWREIRNQEINISHGLGLETLGHMADVSEVMTELGFSPILTTEEIDPDI